MIRSLQYAFIAIIVTTVGFSLYQWNASRASTQKTAPNNGLVGYWSFNEGTGTQAGDASGNNNTGTLTNGPTWTTGRLGQAINFDGVNDYVSILDNSAVNPALITISAWIYYTGGSGGGGYGIVSKYDNSSANRSYLLGIDPTGGTNYILLGASTSGGTQVYGGDSSPGAVPLNKWSHVVMVYDGANVYAYLNGIRSANNYPLTGNLFDNTATLSIGGRIVGSTGYFGGLIDEVRIYNRALSGTEITNLYNLGAEKLNVSPVSNLTSGLVGYWTFDGKDTPWSSSSAGTATDRSGNSNTGTLTNMSQSTSPTIGKLGQALNFDGTDDYTTSPDNATLDVTDSTNFSLSGWFSRNTFTTDDTIIAKSNGQASSDTGYNAYIDDTTDKLTIVANDGTDQYKIESVSTFTATGWHHFTLSWDDTGSANTKLYIDGVSEAATTTGTFANVNSIANALTFRIGAESDNGNPFDGKIDEVRMYNRALSAGEVQSLYDLGASDKVNSSVSQNQGTGRLDSGLAGYWKLDDGSGTNATDASVNSYTGTLTGGPTWTTGQIGGAVNFDGVDDYINTNNGVALDNLKQLSYSAWIYPTSSNGFILGKRTNGGGTSALRLTAGTLQGWIGNFSGAGYGRATSVNTISLSTWSLVTLTYNRSGDNKPHLYINGSEVSYSEQDALDGVDLDDGFDFFIGRIQSNPELSDVPYTGKIDDVRVYNRALSADEVSQLYRLTAPTGVDTSLKGYWSFNGADMSGTTAYDRSGAGNTGTLTNGPTKTIGKLGQALNFDGVDDYVNVGSNSVLNITSTSYTISAWIYPTGLIYGTGSPNKSYSIFDRWDHGCTGYGYAFIATNSIQFNSPMSLQLMANCAGQAWSVGAGNIIVNNKWQHVVAVDNAGTVTFYVNNVATSAANNLAATASYGGPALIGIGPGGINPFPGKIDEVRIYNRALSAIEVAALYNSGR